jgi:hypothetical protein
MARQGRLPPARLQPGSSGRRLGQEVGLHLGGEADFFLQPAVVAALAEQARGVDLHRGHAGDRGDEARSSSSKASDEAAVVQVDEPDHLVLLAAREPQGRAERAADAAVDDAVGAAEDGVAHRVFEEQRVALLQHAVGDGAADGYERQAGARPRGLELQARRVLLAEQDRPALGGHGREEQVEQELEELGQRTVHDELVRGLAQRVQDPVLPRQGLHDLGAAVDARGEVPGRELADVQPVRLGRIPRGG